jgi:hypothetical protein
VYVPVHDPLGFAAGAAPAPVASRSTSAMTEAALDIVRERRI